MFIISSIDGDSCCSGCKVGHVFVVMLCCFCMMGKHSETLHVYGNVQILTCRSTDIYIMYILFSHKPFNPMDGAKSN